MRILRLAAAVATLAVGCRPHAPPPAVAEAPPAPAAEEPPPPPKCESLEERCVAKEGVRVSIEGAPWTMAAPAGWTYAKVASGLVAVSEGSALAVHARAVADKKKPPRAEALAAVVEHLRVTFAKRKGKLELPRRADKTIAVGPLKIALYQLDGATRESKSGPLLVFATTLPEGPLLVGGGFVPQDDATNADAAILAAIESLAPEKAP